MFCRTSGAKQRGRVNTIGAYPGDQPTGPVAQTVVPHFASHLGTIYVFREGVFLRDRPMRDCVRMIDEEPHKEEAKQYGKRKQAYEKFFRMVLHGSLAEDSAVSHLAADGCFQAGVGR